MLRGCSQNTNRMLRKKVCSENYFTDRIKWWSKFMLTTFSTVGQRCDVEANLFLLRPKRTTKKTHINNKKNSLNLLSWSSSFDFVIFTKWLFICLYFVLRNSISNFIVKGKKKNISSIQRFFCLFRVVGYLLLYADLL